MKLDACLFDYPFFTLLTSPVASGKTRLVVEFYRQHQFKIIYLSPLRALANEVYKNLKNREEKNVYLCGGEESLDDCYEKFVSAKKAFLVTTAELLDDHFLEYVADQKVIVVIDEFHLFYYWGETFRPLLLDKIFSMLNLKFPVLAVTATMDEEIIHKMRLDLMYHDDAFIHLDYGNHQLHRKPSQINCFDGFNERLMYRYFCSRVRHKSTDEIYLYFCAYRSEVDDVVTYLRRRGLKAFGCVGGEVQRFLSEIEAAEKIDCIVSTTALSHGVNLPEIHKVFVGYKVMNYDFWLQMIGRGGRQGASYEVYTYDTYLTSLIERIKTKIKIYTWDFLGLEIL